MAPMHHVSGLCAARAMPATIAAPCTTACSGRSAPPAAERARLSGRGLAQRAVAEHHQRGARRTARADAGEEADAVLVGGAQDDLVHLALAAGGVDEEVD